jgi:hypothetical protein
MSIWSKFTRQTGGPTARNATMRIGALCVIMAIGAVVLQVAGWQVEKPDVPLRESLATFPTLLENRWEKIGDDKIMSAEEEFTLQTNKYLIRRYRDLDKRAALEKIGFHGMGTPEFRAAKIGELLSLNINYYPNGRSDTHVPDVCWTGSGMERDNTDTDEFIIKDVDMGNGTKIDLPVRMVAFQPTSKELKANPEWRGKENQHLLFVMYTFNINGEYEAKRESLSEMFHKFSDWPFLYHAKIEVTLNERCSKAEAKPVLERFFRAVMPEATRCLPDAKEELAKAEAKKKGKALTAPATQSGGAQGPETKPNETRNSN